MSGKMSRRYLPNAPEPPIPENYQPPAWLLERQKPFRQQNLTPEERRELAIDLWAGRHGVWMDTPHGRQFCVDRENLPPFPMTGGRCRVKPQE
jgi:hypothetical protein